MLPRRTSANRHTAPGGELAEIRHAVEAAIPSNEARRSERAAIRAATVGKGFLLTCQRNENGVLTPDAHGGCRKKKQPTGRGPEGCDV
jgi:hypothetical protein